MNKIDTCLYILTGLAVVNTYLLYRMNVNMNIIAAVARNKAES